MKITAELFWIADLQNFMNSTGAKLLEQGSMCPTPMYGSPVLQTEKMIKIYIFLLLFEI